MAKANKETPESVWRAFARSTARRFNCAWFLEKLSLPLLIAGLVGAGAVLFTRRELAVFPWDLSLAVTGGVLLLVTLLSWLIAKRHFTNQESALVRLEDAMNMDNSLTAARLGIAPWPEATAEARDGTQWNWPRLLVPPVVTLLLLSAAFLLPISAKSDRENNRPEEPTNRQALQASLDELREDNTIDEEYLDELEEKLEELREKPEEEWFDHSSLEATDNLKEAHEQQLKELEQQLKKAERSLNALQNHSSNMGAETRERLLNEFDQAVQQMGQGAMKPNKELLEKLGKLDPQQLKNLTPEQLNQLRENMREQAQKMKQAGGNPGQQGGGGGAGDEWLDELMEEGGQNGQGDQGQGPDGPEGAGNGGVGRGPGTAPGVLGQKDDELKTGDMEGLESRDLSNTLPGDLLELQDGEHQLDKREVGVRAGGEVEDLGEGGDLIWKVAPDLHPDEKKALREFFK